jgi:ATP:ADP antiporter, AAA family
MVHRIIRLLWGDLRGDELKKFLMLATGFFFLIGPYWLLKTLKDSIFVNTVGPEHHPTVKILSVILSLPLVLFYSKLVDIMSKEKMVYFLVGLYGILGMLFVYFFYDPNIGLANTTTSSTRLIGWLFFLYVESYISLMISLYWAFINDITTPESAKKGYGLIIFGSQLGGFTFIVLGDILSADASLYASRGPLISLIAVSCLLLMAPITYLLYRSVNKENLKSYQEGVNYQEEPKSAGISFLDGLKVILTHPYVAGIFSLIFFHELISTVMNYQMLWLAKSTYVDAGLVNKFFFDYALAVQAIACVFALVGTSFFQRRFGITFCIVAYPLLLGASIIWYLITPSLQTIFYVMLIAKAINFAFNQPAKEVLYIPTSKNIKYKSKAWVDMFGLRFAKASGSVINKLAGQALGVTGFVVIGFIGIWVALANIVGKHFQKAVNEKRVID